ncbi:hypothetical protein AB6A40_006402 [Gnathostoma spinigerum]|uniref:GRIP1-associated protein 1 n=1 Tax=Gnathostoma spinigerum TaxID=75299 RepID=A0ABD6ERR4_9BILA
MNEKDDYNIKNGLQLKHFPTQGTTISGEEFSRIQEQLLELRNKNYELLEENKRLRQIPTSDAKSDALDFASKLIGFRRGSDEKKEKISDEVLSLRKKVLTQEEEFRLQQSTLLSELNRVLARCEELEAQAAQNEILKTSEDKQSRPARSVGIGTSCSSDLDCGLFKEVNADLKVKDRSFSELENEKADLPKHGRGSQRQAERPASSEKNVGDTSSCAVEQKSKETMTDPPLRTTRETVTDSFLFGDASKERDQFLAEIAVLQNNLSEATLTCKNHETELKNLRQSLAETRASIETLKSEKAKNQDMWNEERTSLSEQLSQAEMSLIKLDAEKSKFLIASSELETEKAELESRIAAAEEKLKAKGEEMKVALKKQASMVRELRRQVQQEKKRADQYERQMEETLGGRPYRLLGPGCSSETARLESQPAAEGSSTCSWAFIAESDRNSIHTLDGDESMCSASVLESDNAELITRVASLQKKYSELSDHSKMLEDENQILRREVQEKNEVISEWIRSRPVFGENHLNSSPNKIAGVSLRRMIDMVRVDETASDIRDMNRRLQRMLEETLSKNLFLQKEIQALVEQKKVDEVV